ncbi:MAG: hydroxyacid dehydrogenase [Ferruginibacter sp.]|nr:hydroxyacid dehydrogenase [Ferruginibacter sp.]
MSSMKVVAYGLEPHEKRILAAANNKQHDITVIANPLSLPTVDYASGKNAIIIAGTHEISFQLIAVLAELGVKFILCWCLSLPDADVRYAISKQILLFNIGSPELNDCPEEDGHPRPAFSQEQVEKLASDSVKTLNELQLLLVKWNDVTARSLFDHR